MPHFQCIPSGSVVLQLGSVVVGEYIFQGAICTLQETVQKISIQGSGGCFSGLLTGHYQSKQTPVCPRLKFPERFALRVSTGIPLQCSIIRTDVPFQESPKDQIKSYHVVITRRFWPRFYRSCCHHLAPSKTPFLRSSHYGNGLCEVSRTCSETLNMNARHRLSFSLFPVKFSQIDLFYKYLDMFWWNCNPAGFLIKRAKRRLGCPEKQRKEEQQEILRLQCVDLIELTGHKKNRFPFDSLVPRVFSVNAPKSPDDSMCLTLDSGASFLLNTKRLPGL